MTCEAYRALLDRALNGEATPAELEEMRWHEQTCTECAALHRELNDLQNDLASLKEEVPPMPEDFHQRWTALVEEDTMDQQPKNNRFRQQLTRILSVAAALVFVIGGTILTRDDLAPRSVITTPRAAKEDVSYDSGYVSGGANTTMSKSSRASGNENGAALMNYESSEDMAMEYADTDLAGGVEERPSKIIRTASLTLATRTYDLAMEQLRAAVNQYGGWISYCYETTTSGSLHRANLTLRIPSQHLDAFLNATGDVGRVTSRSESATDVSDSYYDTKTRLATQQALLERLQALITNAADLSDLLELENQIANTQYTIDRLTGSLQSTDRQVDYATVDVTLREESAASEVVQTELSLGQRLVSAFAAGWQSFADFAEDIMVFLVAALPFILTVIVLIVVLRIVSKRRKQKKS